MGEKCRASLNLSDSSQPTKLLHLAIRGSVRGSIAQQPRLLAENCSVGTLRITQGTHIQIWPGEAAVLAKQKNGAPPPPPSSPRWGAARPPPRAAWLRRGGAHLCSSCTLRAGPPLWTCPWRWSFPDSDMFVHCRKYCRPHSACLGTGTAPDARSILCDTVAL